VVEVEEVCGGGGSNRHLLGFLSGFLFRSGARGLPELGGRCLPANPVDEEFLDELPGDDELEILSAQFANDRFGPCNCDIDLHQLTGRLFHQADLARFFLLRGRSESDQRAEQKDGTR